MSCSNMKNPRFKSCARVYNNNNQTVTAALTPLVLEGSPVVDSGCSICINSGNFVIEHSGLYHLSADVTFTPTSSGTFVIQFYKDGIALPCTLTQAIVSAGNTVTLHVETDLQIGTCCINQPSITLDTSGVAGTVNHVCSGVLRLA